ncbi:cytokine receptor family member b4 [Anabas testudineus]|uniref:Fibronectin type-III domain-containing protein n=1 Tax=Anabas testudineus TaxID=64144 RepID=A0A3Q1HPR1_ANATE|nr:cytokine receptor family member b4 [Anabas testudineus]
MSATVCAFILTFTILCSSRVVSGFLGRPKKVNLTSYNMNLVLQWDPPEGVNNSLVYTTEYKSSVGLYSVGCANITTLKCDLSSLRISGRPSIAEYGTYIGRVQAHLGSESSAWVESNQITLDKETIIGSPSVSLFTNGATIEVIIKEPEFVISSLRNVYSHVTYNITYWKDGQKEKANHISKMHQNRVVLDKLDQWSNYCVQVQINTIDSGPNPSEPSTIVCQGTTTEEEIPWVAAVVTFIVMTVAVALVVVAVVYRRSISHFLCPKDALPQHIKEYLLMPPNSTIYLAMQKPTLPEENYDLISIIADEKSVKEESPLEVAGNTCSKQSNVMVREK